jgi:hypothetical protein
MSERKWCQGFCTLCGTGCAEYCDEARELRAEIDALKREVARLSENLFISNIAAVRMERKINKFRSVIRYYANPRNWRTRGGKLGVTRIWVEDQEQISGKYVGGKRARQTLQWSKPNG